MTWNHQFLPSWEVIAQTSFEKADLVLPSQLPPNDHTLRSELHKRHCRSFLELLLVSPDHAILKSRPWQRRKGVSREARMLPPATRSFVHDVQACLIMLVPFWLHIESMLIHFVPLQTHTPAETRHLLVSLLFECSRRSQFCGSEGSKVAVQPRLQSAMKTLHSKRSQLRHRNFARCFNSGQVIRNRDCTKLVSCVCTTCKDSDWNQFTAAALQILQHSLWNPHTHGTHCGLRGKHQHADRHMCAMSRFYVQFYIMGSPWYVSISI